MDPLGRKVEIPAGALVLTAREAAVALRIGERTLARWTAEGKIPCVRVNRSVRYDVKDLQAWIDSQKVRQVGAA